MVHRWSFARGLALLTVCSGCPNALPELPSRPSDAGAQILLDPATALDAARRVVQIRRRGSGAGEAAGLRVFRGALSAADLGRLGRNEISASLEARRVAVFEYERGGEPISAPVEVLQPGDTYSVVTDPAILLGTFTVAADAPPALERFWPPADGGTGIEHVVYCSDSGALPEPEDVVLQPSGIAARILPGAGAAGDDSGCVHLSSAARLAADGGAVAPPDVGGRALDPELLRGGAGPLLTGAPCQGAELEFGAGCVRVSDDRVFLRSTDQPILWILSGGITLVRSAAPGATLEIGGLMPDTDYRIDIGMVDLASRYYAAAAEFRTLVSAPHLVINEVLANAVGAEPAQEWVEIANDGRTAVDLKDWTIEDVGGVTALPAASLAPGAYALIVADAYDPASAGDVPPSADALLVRVARLGKNGLSNSGEALRLRDPAGQLLSTFPAIAAPRAGVSAARRTLSTPDDDSGGFGLHANPGASPGGPNTVEP